MGLKFADIVSAVNPIVGAGMGLLLGNKNDERQYEQQEKLQGLQIKGQKEMTDYNMSKQLQMWKDTSYRAQKEQMKIAGINPALMYGMGGGGGQSVGSANGNVTGGQAPSGGGEVQAMTGMGIQTAAQLALITAQKENIEANTVKTKTEAAKIGGVDTALAGTQIASLKQNIKNMEANEALTRVTTALETVKKDIAEDTEAYQKGIIQEQWNRISKEVDIIRRQDDIGAATKVDAIKRIKADAVNAVLEGALIKAQTKKMGTSANVDVKQIQVMTQQISASIAQQLQGWESINVSKDKNFIMQKLGEAGIELQDRGQILGLISGIAGLGKTPMDHTTESESYDHETGNTKTHSSQTKYR